MQITLPKGCERHTFLNKHARLPRSIEIVGRGSCVGPERPPNNAARSALGKNQRSGPMRVISGIPQEAAVMMVFTFFGSGPNSDINPAAIR
jgi:hypothetical protein